jgi:hypothetical protein
MYSLLVADADGVLVQIDTHDTCESAVQFMLDCWYEDGQSPSLACVTGPDDRVVAIIRQSADPHSAAVIRKGGSVTFHAVKDAPLVTIG